MSGRVVVAGSVNADLVVHTDRLPGPGHTVVATEVAWHAGGKGANQAAAASLAGARATIVGCLGRDDHADRLRAALSGRRVDVSLLRTVDGPCGQAHITVDAGGENTIVVVPGANDALAPAHVEAVGAGLGPDDVAVTVCEIAPATALAFLRAAAGARKVLNPTPPERCPPELLAAADLIVVNEHEAAVLDPPADRTIITMGAAGARFGRHHLTVRPAGAVLDTTGAGDCFVGTLAARLAAGDGIEAAIAAANEAAARSVTRPGAMESYS